MMMSKISTLWLLLTLPVALYAQNREVNMHGTAGDTPVLSGGGKLPESSPVILTGQNFTAVKGVYLRYAESEASIEDIPSFTITDTQITIKAIQKKTHDETTKTTSADICLRIGDKPDFKLDVCTNYKPIVFTTPYFNAAGGDFHGNDSQYQSNYPAAAMVNHNGETLTIHLASNYSFADKSTVKFDNEERSIQQTSTTTFSTTTPSHPYGKPKLMVYNGGNDPDLEQAEIKDENGKFGFYRINFMCQAYHAIPCTTPIPDFTDDPNMKYTFEMYTSSPTDRCSPGTTDPMHYDHFRTTALVFPEKEPPGYKIACNYMMQEVKFKSYLSKEPINTNRVVDKVLGNSTTPEGQECESTTGNPADCAYRYTVLPN